MPYQKDIPQSGESPILTEAARIFREDQKAREFGQRVGRATEKTVVGIFRITKRPSGIVHALEEKRYMLKGAEDRFSSYLRNFAKDAVKNHPESTYLIGGLAISWVTAAAVYAISEANRNAYLRARKKRLTVAMEILNQRS